MDLYLDSGVHVSSCELRNKEPHVVLDMIGVDKSYIFLGNIMLYYFLSPPPPPITVTTSAKARKKLPY